MRRGALSLALVMMLASLAAGVVAPSRVGVDPFGGALLSVLAGCIMALVVLVVWGLSSPGDEMPVASPQRRNS